MRLVLPKVSFYQFLFGLCVLAPYFNNYELTFGIWTICALLSVSKAYSVSILKQLSCFIAILAIALVVGFAKDYQTYYIIRDITYMLKPILGLLIGYQLCRRIKENMLVTFVHTGIVVALYHMILLVIAVAKGAHDVNAIRYEAGYFSDYEVYALILLLFGKKFELGFSRQKTFYVAVLLSFSIFMYMARTNFIQFGVLTIAMMGYFRVTKRSIAVVTAVVGIALIGYSAILYINPKRNGKGLEALLYKIKIAPTEPFKTKIDRTDWKDINDNYRSFENIMTIKQVTSKDATYFGEGIGSKIDLKQKMWLGDIEQRYISILHNAFMTVFLKSGLLGIVFLIASIFLLFKNPRSDIPIVRTLNRLFVGTGIFMIISAWVFMGLYFLADTKSIVIGALICVRGLLIRSHNTVPHD